MNYNWVPGSIYQGLPHNAVHAGNDSDGCPLYVGRAYHEGDQCVAKVIPSKQAAYISHNGMEILKHNYEVLTGYGFTWVHSGNGHVPPGAILAGNTAGGEPLYVGRAHYEGSVTPGKVHRSHGCLYIPYGGMERSVTSYEVLISQQRSAWIGCAAQSPVPPGAILAAHDVDGAPMYVGRAFHEGEQIPAKVLPTKQVAYISYNGVEIPKYSFEVLCNGNVQWIPSSNGQVLPNAVLGGRTATGETLYIGRGHWGGAMIVGKVHPSHGTLYVPFNGSEIPIRNYELLIEN